MYPGYHSGNWTHVSAISLMVHSGGGSHQSHSGSPLLIFGFWDPSRCFPSQLVGVLLASLPGFAMSVGALLAACAAAAPAVLARACQGPGHLFMMSSSVCLSTCRESMLLKCWGDTMRTSTSRVWVPVDMVSSLPAHSRL